MYAAIYGSNPIKSFWLTKCQAGKTFRVSFFTSLQNTITS